MKGLRPLHTSPGSTCLFFDRLTGSESSWFFYRSANVQRTPFSVRPLTANPAFSKHRSDAAL